MRRDSYAADRRRDPIGVALKLLGSIIRNEIPEMNVLPCPRREAELIGEVAQRDGGVRCHCSGWPCIRLQPLPGCAVLPLLTTLRSVNRGR